MDLEMLDETAAKGIAELQRGREGEVDEGCMNSGPLVVIFQELSMVHSGLVGWVRLPGCLCSRENGADR